LFQIEVMSDEAHFPAKPSRARTPPRLPGAVGDPRRAQGIGRPSGSGPQDPVSLIPASLTPPGLTTLTRRPDFLAANSGKRAPMPGFVLLVRPRGDDSPDMRLGITVTKKIGNAVVRNRMKRRFRALARDLLPIEGVAGADHVLIGRAGGVERDFADLKRELSKALAKVKR
jgi:ribonuclease P protein component